MQPLASRAGTAGRPMRDPGTVAKRGHPGAGHARPAGGVHRPPAPPAPPHRMHPSAISQRSLALPAAFGHPSHPLMRVCGTAARAPRRYLPRFYIHNHETGLV